MITVSEEIKNLLETGKLNDDERDILSRALSDIQFWQKRYYAMERDYVFLLNSNDRNGKEKDEMIQTICDLRFENKKLKEEIRKKTFLGRIHDFLKRKFP
jgi:hypothetical protein